jgi:integrase
MRAVAVAAAVVTLSGVMIGDNMRGSMRGRGLGKKTTAQYMNTIRRAESWCEEQGVTLRKVRPEQLADYADTLPRTWASRKGLRQALSVYWEIVGRRDPPLAAIRVPAKPEMVCRAHEEDDARILAKAAAARHDPKGLAVLLGMYEAMRREEIATMPWAHVDPPWLVVIGKFDKQRRIPVHPVVDEALAEHRQSASGPWVFAGRFGGPVASATIWSWIREVAEDAGVEAVTPHRLRHTSLATANDATGNLRAVQAFAGHARPDTTAGYTRASTRALRAVVDAIRYD